MLLSAVSLGAILLGQISVKTSSVAGNEAWRNIRRSIVTLQHNGADKGVAVCIDKRGYFIAHKGIVDFPLTFAKLSTGQMVQLKLKATDPMTQLVLFEAEGPAPTFQVAGLAMEPEKPFPLVYSVVPGATIETEIVDADKIGVMSKSLRAIPMIELKFEASLTRVGGAPVFNKNGELLGFLNATVQGDAREEKVQQRNANVAPPRSAGPTYLSTDNVQYGPVGLTVGYAIGPSALARVVEGFLSPNHEVTFPSIGIFLTDAKEGGAEVRQVQEKSPALEAGLIEGDVIFEMNGMAIRNQIDYAKQLLRQKSGIEFELKVRRKGEVMTLRVTPTA